MVCGKKLRLSAKSRARLAGLLIGGVVGLPLRADEPTLAELPAAEPTPVKTVQASVGDEKSPGFRFTAAGEASDSRSDNLLRIGEKADRSTQSRQSGQSTGLSLEGGAVPRRSGNTLRLTSEGRSSHLPPGNSKFPTFRFDDDQPNVARRRGTSNGMTLSIDGSRSTPETATDACQVQGFSFAAPNSEQPSTRPNDLSTGEPTLAHDLPAVNTWRAVEQQKRRLQAILDSDPELVPGARQPDGQSGQLTTIRQRTDAVPQSEAAVISQQGTAVPAQSLTPVERPRPAGIATPPLPQAEPTHRSTSPTGGDVARMPAASPELQIPPAKPVSEWEQAPATQRPPQSPVPSTAEPIDWSFAEQSSEAGWHVRQVDSASHAEVPIKPGAPWHAAGDIDDIATCAEIAAGQLLLPVGASSHWISAFTAEDTASIASASNYEEPAWLKPAPDSAPLTMEIEASYAGATKPSGAAALPETDSAYTMGPGRVSRPLPEGQVSRQPQYGRSHGSGNITASSIELAALLQDLEPLTPGGPQLPGEQGATTPSAGDFPDTSDEPAADAAGDAAAQTLGEAPEETDEPLQFLRRQTVLLEPGEHQFDIGIGYLNDTSDFPVLFSDGANLGVVRGQTRQRLLSVPLELRVGIAPYTQAFVNVPFGWSNTEVAFNGNEFTQDEGGIGDVSAGVTKQVVMGNQYYPDVLASVAFSAPTGNSSLATALETPGASLGQGFWTLTGSLSFIQTYDPVVFFYGLGYTFRFQNEFGDDVKIEPGDQVFYRFGAGFAVNPHVTLSAAFTGSVIGRDEVNDIEIGGSIREPMSIRLAATISRRKGSKTHSSFKIVEPYVNFGLNEDSIDSLFGISWTY